MPMRQQSTHINSLLKHLPHNIHNARFFPKHESALTLLSEEVYNEDHPTYFALEMNTCGSRKLHESQPTIHCVYTTIECL